MTYEITYGRTISVEIATITVEASSEDEAIRRAEGIVTELDEGAWDQTEINQGAQVIDTELRA